MKRIYGALMALAAACSFDPTPVASANPLDGVDYSVRRDGTMQLRGGVDIFVFDFGSASGAMAQQSPVGLKEVSMARDLHVSGEHTKQLLIAPPHTKGGDITIGGGNLVAGDPSKTTATVTMDGDHSKEAGWAQWYGRATSAIEHAWPGTIPGQAQVVIEFSKKGQVTALQTLAFIPAVNKAGKFEIEQVHPGVRKKFIDTINEALAAIPADAVAFPQDSTANSACVLATFTSDNNLSLPVPDLVVVGNLPQTEEALRTYRICTILEIASLYKTSELLKARLPKQNQTCYVPVDAPHRLYSPGHNFYILAFGSGNDLAKSEAALGDENRQKVVGFINKCIDSKRYDDAEDLAKAMAAVSNDPAKLGAVINASAGK
jgi:hypothetical protein